MLSGTAIGIFFASAPTNHLSIRKFWTAFSNIFQGKYYNTTQCYFCWCKEKNVLTWLAHFAPGSDMACKLFYQMVNF